MLAAIVLLMVKADWDMPLLTPTVFPVLSGKNGAEEYVQAIDVLRAKHYDAYSDWRMLSDRPPGGSVKYRSWDANTTSDRRYVDLITRLDTLSPLAFRKEEVSLFRAALDLVKRGNEKPASFPTEAITFKFPPVGELSYLVRLGANAAYLEFADGRPDAAADDLISVARMNERLASMDYMQTMVGVLGRQNLLKSFARNMDRLSLDGCKRFEELANEILREPPGFLAAFKHDVVSLESQVPDQLASLHKDVAYMQMLAGASDAVIAQQIVAGIQSNSEVALRRFDGPENTWLPDTNTDAPDVTQTLPKNLPDLVSYMSQAMTPPLGKRAASIQRDMQSRAQIRLLRLAARILQFRWTWDRLPSSLDEMRLPSEYVFDPLSNQPFVYELHDPTFRLYSKGWNGKGEVDFFRFPSQGAARTVNP